MTIRPAQLRNLFDYDTLMEFLADKLEWPMDFYEADVDDYAFEYTPEELGIAPKHTAKIRSVRQLRPLDDSQPWGVFHLEFDTKQLPVVVLRRILRTLVRRKRETANPSERRVWELRDLLFISAVGKNKRGITFAYFQERNDGIPQLRTFEWDEDETQFGGITPKLEALRWPENPNGVDSWRNTWASAFPVRHRYSVSTAKDLSKAMAELAKRTKEKVLEVYSYESEKTGPLRKLHESFRQALIQDLDKEGFADMLAQTLAYGLFSVRASGAPKIDLSSLSELPNTNPFLQELLAELVNLAGLEEGKIDFDELSVSDLIMLLNEADMAEVLSSFGRTSRGGADDPVIHFYEDFLKDYDAAQKVQRGVFYTPKPVVSFIVRSVHELLQTEFGLADGLADTTTWGEMKAKNLDLDLPKDVSPDAPSVQILDPATGTGTFLETVIDVIHECMVTKWRKQGMDKVQVEQAWNEYVPEHLLSRLYGFELMMAPYAVAHLKLGLRLRQTGYSFNSNSRLNLFLTNALESVKKSREQQTLDMPGFLAHEAQTADEVKQRAPLSVIIGNPPYSNFGMMNKSQWILGLLEDYKEGLEERKLNLDDDFIKFFRLGQYYVQRASIGVLALITNNIYIDGLTHRQMRKSLTETFDAMHLLDLHGEIEKDARVPKGLSDKNVFDIGQGVAIGIFAARNVKNADTVVEVDHHAIWGDRQAKFDYLSSNSTSSVNYTPLTNVFEESCLGRFYFFAPKGFENIKEYCSGYRMDSIFSIYNSGIQTKKDHLTVHFTADDMRAVVQDVKLQTEDVLRELYNLGSDGRDWTVRLAKKDVRESRGRECLLTYRPFDQRHSYYTGRTKGFMAYPRSDVMNHMLRPNTALITMRQIAGTADTCEVFVSHHPVTDRSMYSTRGTPYLFPLNLYSDATADTKLFASSAWEKSGAEKTPNITEGFVSALEERIRLKFSLESLPNDRSSFCADDVLHYIYAVTYSPSYRSRFAEFLRIDFPRVPLTSSLELFRSLCTKGQALVNLHLMEGQNDTFTRYPVSGDDVVDKPRYQEPQGGRTGRVYINKTQYFEDVPPEVWEFYIGGYQVCQKWLKDRKGRTLSADDVAHYQKVVAALSGTTRLMAEIDEVIAEHGGWPLVGSVSEDARA